MPVSQVTVEPAKIVKIKPARPTPLSPPNIDPRTLTKETAKKLLEENAVYMCFSWEDWLSNGQFEKEKLNYVKQVGNLLDFYEKELETNDGKDTKNN